jgi:putative transposase
VALASPRPPTLAQRLPLLQRVPLGWHLGEDACCPARAAEDSSQQESSAQRRHRRDSQSVKTTGVGGEQRGYDGGKKVKGRKRHLLVDTEGFVLKAKVHSAKVMDYEGIKELLDRIKGTFPRLSHLWVDGGYNGEDKGGGWVEKTLGWRVEIVSRPRKAAPEKVLMAWAREWAKEGMGVDWQKLLPPQGFVVLPRRWVVERTFSWISQNRRMSKDYERLAATSEAFIYVAMSRLMVRRLARVQ